MALICTSSGVNVTCVLVLFVLPDGRPDFFKEHIQKYRKRPMYWLLQSPRKRYGVWLFHAKLTKDTLYRIRGEQYVASKIRQLDTYLADLRRQRDAAQGRECRATRKADGSSWMMCWKISVTFAERIDTILQRGYTPHIDDGVLITMAPLWELIPSWQAEPKKCWERAERVATMTGHIRP